MFVTVVLNKYRSHRNHKPVTDSLKSMRVSVAAAFGCGTPLPLWIWLISLGDCCRNRFTNARCCWSKFSWKWMVKEDKFVCKPVLNSLVSRFFLFSSMTCTTVTGKRCDLYLRRCTLWCIVRFSIGQWFLTFFAYLTILSNKISKFIPNTVSGAHLLRIRN